MIDLTINQKASLGPSARRARAASWSPPCARCRTRH